jgi:sorbose reductase
MMASLHEHEKVASPPSGIPSLFSLAGRTAIVSGAAAGLGLAIAEILAEAGANVAILYYSNKAAIESAKTVQKRYKVKCTYSKCTLRLITFLTIVLLL